MGLLKLLRFYFRLEVKGLGNIKRQGPLLLVSNHSGFAGLDALILMLLAHEEGIKKLRVLAHWSYFRVFDYIKDFAETYGLREASKANGVQALRNGYSLLIFPEGESGNFKPTVKKYRLQRFHSGAVRIAAEAGVPITPVVVIGAEEAHLTLTEVDIQLIRKRLKLPIPLNLVPLPSKWIIRFGEPIILSESLKQQTLNGFEIKKQNAKIRRKMQRMINEELKLRPFVYSGKMDQVLAKNPFLAKWLLGKWTKGKS